MSDEVIAPWFGDARLAVRRGMHSATGNLYCGLHEFPDMAFLMHMLRPGDVFFDIGANIGSYTVLASKVCRARSVSVEPDLQNAHDLRRNTELNQISDLVTVVQEAVGSETGSASLTVGKGTTNHIVEIASPGLDVQRVPMTTIDTLAGSDIPVVIKFDVEGYEYEAMRGARQVLANRSLLAVETETIDPAISDLLLANGFTRLYYDVFDRALRDAPVSGLDANNALFVRDRDACLARLRSAPWQTIMGHAV